MRNFRTCIWLWCLANEITSRLSRLEISLSLLLLLTWGIAHNNCLCFKLFPFHLDKVRHAQAYALFWRRAKKFFALRLRCLISAIWYFLSRYCKAVDIYICLVFFSVHIKRNITKFAKISLHTIAILLLWKLLSIYVLYICTWCTHWYRKCIRISILIF